MRDAHPDERAVGVAYYASDAEGTGGRLRETPADFRVRELERVDVEPASADPGDYDHLVVRATLRDWETNRFARDLANRLGIGRGRVAWAGTKDKRAVTTQLFSIAGVGPEALPSMAGAELAVVGRLGRALRFGDLAGNAFVVVVSGAERPGQVEPVTRELATFAGLDPDSDGPDGRADVGVPNYFGHQRFGSIRPVTHVVGRHVVRRDWEGAVMAYLGDPVDVEPSGTREARRFVEETRDWAAAAERFPPGLTYERALCHRLAESGDGGAPDFHGALEALPWTLRRLFVNAAQSEAFNRMLSRRLERGLPFDRAVAGDVVCFATAADGLAVPDPGRTQAVTPDRVETVNRHAERGRAFVTAPLVGTETELADGEPGEIERAVLDDLDLAPAEFDLPEPYGSTGTRRTVLLPTTVEAERDPLTFRFELPAGAYATVLLREYLKVDPRSL